MNRIFIFVFEALVLSASYVTVADENLDAVDANLSNPAFLATLLENFLDLGIKTLREAQKNSIPSNPHFDKCDLASVNTVVGNRVNHLRSSLHDDDYDKDDRLTIKSTDDTTIVEIVTDITDNKKNAIRDKVQKYKRLRKKILKALIKESVSDQTINLTVQTLDEMIARKISSQCPLKRNANDISQNAGSVSEIPKAWKLEWNKMKERYSELFQGNPMPENRTGVVRSLIEKLPSFFSNVLKDGEKLAKRYKLRCERINDSEESGRIPFNFRENFNDSHNSLRSDACGTHQISICSMELKHYIVNIYKTITTTMLKVLNDFIAMYKLDVNMIRKSGYKVVIDGLEKVGQLVKQQACSIFTKEISKFDLPKSHLPAPYLKAVSVLSKNIMDRMMFETRQDVRRELKVLNARLRERIVEDIKANMEVESARLEKYFKLSACKAFETCNNKLIVSGRRRETGKNDVYVKVQMTIDDDFENNLIDPSGTTELIKVKVNEAKSPNVNITNDSNQSYKNTASVTRTTKSLTNDTNNEIFYKRMRK